MLAEDVLSDVARRLKKFPLLPDGAGVAVARGSDSIEQLLPHRGAMLLLDAIDAVDPVRLTVRGRRYLAPDDRGFDGHFPGDPVYPGVLVVEAIGQLALTLLALRQWDATPVGATGASPRHVRRVRALHIHRASFVSPFAPGDTMILHAQVIDHNGLTMLAAGQAWNREALAAFAVTEVYLDE